MQKSRPNMVLFGFYLFLLRIEAHNLVSLAFYQPIGYELVCY